MGSAAKTVEVHDYDVRWLEEFKRSREELLSVLGEKGGRIHHIGSTSVPGLAAKPVIDILIEVPDITAVDVATAQFQVLGYLAKGEFGIVGRRYFSKAAGTSLKVHVHVFSIGDSHVFRHLVFREYLRTHSDAALRYGNLKHALAVKHLLNRNAYQADKEFMVEDLSSSLRRDPVVINQFSTSMGLTFHSIECGEMMSNQMR